MKKIVILASTPISHILPLQPLINFLNKYKFEIHCFSSIENKNQIIEYGMIFHKYPAEIFRELGQKKDLTYLDNVNKLWNNGNFIEGYDLFLEEDTRQMYNITKSKILEMEKIINFINPDLIFRDSADKVGYYLSKNSPIPVIGYITNNLYSEKFFSQDPIYLYSLLMNLNKVNKNIIENKQISSYFKQYREKMIMMNNKIAKSINMPPLNVMHQFDPMNYLTIIFSIDDLQPNISLYEDRKYDLIYPNENRFRIETQIDESLKKFLSQADSVIYIATGSIFSNLETYYLKYIIGFSNTEYKIVISCKDYYEKLQQYTKKFHINNVYISNYIPQKYILNKAKLFITSGGQNSILESIYFKVPMLVDPISSEQRLNGLMIEKMEIGLTSNNGYKKVQTTGEMITYLINSSHIKKQLEHYSKIIKNHNNEFKELKDFLKSKKII